MDSSLWCWFDRDGNPNGDALGFDDADIYDADNFCGFGGSSGNARRSNKASALSRVASTSSSVATLPTHRVETTRGADINTGGRAEVGVMPANDGALVPSSRSQVVPTQTSAAAYNEYDKEIGLEIIEDYQCPMPDTATVSEGAALKKTCSTAERQGPEIIEDTQGPIPDSVAAIGEDVAAPKKSHATVDVGRQGPEIIEVTQGPIPDTATMVGDDAALKKSRVPRFLRNLATRFTATVMGKDVAALKKWDATGDVERQGPEIIEDSQGPIPHTATGYVERQGPEIIEDSQGPIPHTATGYVEREGPEIIEDTQGLIPDAATTVSDDAALKKSRVPRFLQNFATRLAPTTLSSTAPQASNDNGSEATNIHTPTLMATLVQAVKGTLITPNEQTNNTREGPIYEAERVSSFREDATHIYNTQPTPWWKKYHGYIYVFLLLTIAAMAVVIGLLAHALRQIKEGDSALMSVSLSTSSSTSPIPDDAGTISNDMMFSNDMLTFDDPW